MSTNSVVARSSCYGHFCVMLTKSELLAAIEAKGISNKEMMAALGLASSRVSEIMRAAPGNTSGKQPRELSYDEGVKLVRAFGLDEAPQPQPTPLELPETILRLAVRHMAASLGVEPSEDLLQALSADLRAFVLFAADPSVKKTTDMAEGFFRGMLLRRLGDPEAAPPGSDPHHAH